MKNKSPKFWFVSGSVVLLVIIGMCTVAIVATDPEYADQPAVASQPEGQPSDAELWRFQQNIIEFCTDLMVDFGMVSETESQNAVKELRKIKDPRDSTRLKLVMECIEHDMAPINP